MNVFLSLTAVFLGGFAGAYFSKKLKSREHCLFASLSLVNDIEIQIRYTNAEIAEILKAAAQKPEYSSLDFVKNCESVSPNGDFHILWNDGVNSQPSLTADDKDVLLSLGSRLGSTDLDGQLSYLEMTGNRLSALLTEARADAAKKSQMYRSVGLLCGLAAGVMVS